jgi:type IV pilus biogenesis protein CpaD/CtpE
MAMSSINLLSCCRTGARLGCAWSLAILAGACTTPQVNLSDDFGVALRQDLAAQIADPEPRYSGALQPGYDGHRASLAITRYQKGEVIPPSNGNTTGKNTSGSGSGAPPSGPSAGPSASGG